MTVRIPRDEEKMLTRWFRRNAGLRSVHGILLNTAHFAEAARDAVRDHTARERAERMARRAEGLASTSDPWELLPITARPSSAKRPPVPANFEPDGAQLAEAGFTSRRIGLLELAQVASLRIYYGEVGDRYEHGDQPTDDDEKAARAKRRPTAEPAGGGGIANLKVEAENRGQLPRVLSLVHATKAGRELLRAAVALFGRGFDTTDYERIRVLFLFRDRENHRPLVKHFAEAELAAEARYARAAAAWNGTKT